MRSVGPALLALLALLAVVACGRGNPANRVRLATTTSTENSGLLDFVLEPFGRRTGIEVQVIAVGTGKALKLGERGDVDLVLVHAREREDAFLAAGHASMRFDLMWNDFVILGPADDPAGIRGTWEPSVALRRIHDAGAPFVSRGDDSGTHICERRLWEEADRSPRGNDKYYEVGQGMGACLTQADERQAYVLADRGTWLAYRRRLELDVLVEGHPGLRNPYGVLPVNPERHPHVSAKAARALADYLTSPEGQSRIASFRTDGEVLFHPAASAGTPGD